MSRTLAKLVLMIASALALGTAHGHGDAPAKHGGIIKVANDITFELVVKQDVAELYLDDHGAALATAGMRGKLTVLNGTEKTEVDLKPAGGNPFEARGVKVDPGAKVIATFYSADGQSTMSVRFAIARSATP